MGESQHRMEEEGNIGGKSVNDSRKECLTVEGKAGYITRIVSIWWKGSLYMLFTLSIGSKEDKGDNLILRLAVSICFNLDNLDILVNEDCDCWSY